jgi:glycosyltransferase involved in cell wall biosynthesis
MVQKHNTTGVVHLLGSLIAGGMERIAVDLANHLSQNDYRSFVCTTRADGPLRADLAPYVGYMSLHRRRRLDVSAIAQLTSFVRANHIAIIHAHNSDLFMASLVSLMYPFPKVVWHCHSIHDFPRLSYLFLIRRASAVIAVNDPVRQRIHQQLRYPESRIWYVPNFSTLFENQAGQSEPCVALPGTPGRRIVCVASLYPLKDQLNLVRALPMVLRQVPDAHLILVGGDWPGSVYANTVREETRQLGLQNSVTFLGLRRDIAPILRACDVAVLSSISEGFPVVVLEYGLAGLGTVCTRVGSCAEILDEGRAGLLVPPQDPSTMASALITMLLDPACRHTLAERLRQRVQSLYSLEQALSKIDLIYKAIQ